MLGTLMKLLHSVKIFCRVLSESNEEFDYCPSCGGQGELDLDNSPCFKTQKGCQCETTWEYGLSSMLIGCQNPDNDRRGLWCQVKEDCEAFPELEHIRGSSGLETAFKFDYCDPNCTEAIGVGGSDGCDKTVQGCQCLPRWTYRGLDLQGCVVLDGGPPGPFCSVIPGSCEVGEASGKVQDPETGAVIQELDFCFPHCVDQSGLESLTYLPVSIPSDAEYAQAGVCLTSKSGCSCDKTWVHDGNLDSVSSLYYGCATTADRTFPWCKISDPSSCKIPPRDLTWDECPTECKQNLVGSCTKTQNDCTCKSVWEFEGMGVVGCARPDSYPRNRWCEVDVQTCSDGRFTSIGGVAADYCSEQCS
eukprot:TRINITY_DN12130_c0_g1_i9.p2 TRINITY_DN12130_c0_g1~~TRINITY_DN12130_c0_g1_i9.p2  ORF type:complete len:361 (-),score=27.05 TRINITY_DN12130_c0_g1_i9:366-1448(-)